jgi:hypothetical protein
LEERMNPKDEPQGCAYCGETIDKRTTILVGQDTDREMWWCGCDEDKA